MLDDVFYSSAVQSFANPLVCRSIPYPLQLETTLSKDNFVAAQAEIESWSDYRPTPLHCLKGFSDQVGVSGIYFKDESTRFGLGSFKALGGAYAVQKLLQREITRRTGKKVSIEDVRRHDYSEIIGDIMVATATDGNHGRSVAWGAQRLGVKCVIYIHQQVSAQRQSAMEDLGATVWRIAGHYDDSVHQLAKDASDKGWYIVSDTSYEGYTELPREVMAGYGVMIHEATAELSQYPPITHVLVQGGVGGLAASVCSYIWQDMQDKKPRFIVVEPELAACLFQSAKQREPTKVLIGSETIMAGLSCGEISQLAWEILTRGVDDFVTIKDELVAPTMRLLATGRFGDRPVVSGESGVAGLAALLALSVSPALKEQFGINGQSQVLLFGTEGATDPLIYERLVGQKPESVGNLNR